MCREEVRLNRRLAPRLYLGVRGVLCRSEQITLGDEDDPDAVDCVVEMLRYDESKTLATKLAAGELGAREIAAVAARVTRFHAHARRVRTGESPPVAVERRFERNAHELLGSVEHRAEAERVLALERFAHAFIVAHARELHDPARRGCIREGHGDLRAEHVLVDGDVQIVDCLEFDPALRELDVADDLAFLVADLVALGGARFGDALVKEYRAAGGDPGPDTLIAFYAAYRALVRAKVALVRAGLQPAATAAHGHASRAARDLVGVAERFAWRARLPLVLLVCGLPGSGKSTLAHGLAAASGLPHLSSDVTRKQLARIRPSERGPRAIYSPEWNARTYTELGRRASTSVARIGGAIVDATCRYAADRHAFRSTLGVHAPILFVECIAPPTVLASRAATREHERGRVSDADHEVLRQARDRWEPLDEVAANDHVVVRTDRPPEEIVSDVRALLDDRLLRLSP
jgi:aminoglycoside phosphotransferase family enzyme/predicted kinase